MATTIREGLADFVSFTELSVEEKKYQIGVYSGTTIERPYYRPQDTEKLLAGISNAKTRMVDARLGRIMYDTIRARQRANALYERRREDYYLLAIRNAESDLYHLEATLAENGRIILGEEGEA